MSVSLVDGHIDDAPRMTDNEIIKALECCLEDDYKCNECPLYADCDSEAIAKHSLDLINRQKAEIEKLCMELDEVIITKDLLFDEAEILIKKAKAETVREFAERVKQKTLAMVFSPDVLSFEDYCECIDNLVKEMVGDTE